MVYNATTSADEDIDTASQLVRLLIKACASIYSQNIVLAFVMLQMIQFL